MRYWACQFDVAHLISSYPRINKFSNAYMSFFILNRSDVFSFGVILWELMTQSIPWVHLNSLQVSLSPSLPLSWTCSFKSSKAPLTLSHSIWKVVGIVGFMDRRLDLPEGLEPRVSSLIQDCWKTYASTSYLFNSIPHWSMQVTETKPHFLTYKMQQPRATSIVCRLNSLRDIFNPDICNRIRPGSSGP